MGPQNRVERIFVDYLRNQKGASTVAAYSVRARPGLGVSLPVSLEEVRHLEGADQWRLGNVRDYLNKRSDDPWADYGNTRQRLGGSCSSGCARTQAALCACRSPDSDGRQRIPTTLYPGGRAARHPSEPLPTAASRPSTSVPEHS